MLSVDDVFDALVGEIAWSVQRGHGSWIAMEFGRSHLQVREPIISQAALPRARENAARRRVFVRGQKRLLIMDSAWSITAWSKACRHTDANAAIDSVLRLIDGQQLISVSFRKRENSLTLGFDLGGALSVWPCQGRACLWSVCNFDTGSLVTLKESGDLVLQKVGLRQPGMMTWEQ